MIYEDLRKLYDGKEKTFGIDAYKHVSELLIEAKNIHKQNWLKNPTPNMICINCL